MDWPKGRNERKKKTGKGKERPDWAAGPRRRRGRHV